MHHAYVFEGPLSLLPQLQEDARAQLGFKGAHNPDVHVREFPKFGIDESRWLIRAAALKSSSGRALFILGIGSITSEAQQALLKLLEEPQEGMIFLLLVPHGVLLSTVRSRTQNYQPKGEIEELTSKEARAFLKGTSKARTDLIAQMLKDDEGARESVRTLVDALERELHKKIKEPQARAGLNDLSLVRSYLRDRSPSLKMLLEHLAISLPTL